MTRHRILIPLGAFLIMAFTQGCDVGAPTDESTGLIVMNLSLCDPDQVSFITPPGSSNPYFPISTTSTWVYEGVEDGKLVRLEIRAKDTEPVGTVTTRVVEERESADGKLVEVSQNYFAQASNGTVCYFGEHVDNYGPDGITIINNDGSWRADAQGNSPGIIMPANAKPGMKFQMENAPTAMDEGSITGSNPVTVDGVRYTQIIKVREFNPLDGGKSTKIFAVGVGMIVDDVLLLTDHTN